MAPSKMSCKGFSVFDFSICSTSGRHLVCRSFYQERTASSPCVELSAEIRPTPFHPQPPMTHLQRGACSPTPVQQSPAEKTFCRNFLSDERCSSSLTDERIHDTSQYLNLYSTNKPQTGCGAVVERSTSDRNIFGLVPTLPAHVLTLDTCSWWL